MPKCNVSECQNNAVAEVILYDVYYDGSVFYEQDTTCPHICAEHLIDNENRAAGVRQPRGSVQYPFSNQNNAQGFTIYRPL